VESTISSERRAPTGYGRSRASPPWVSRGSSICATTAIRNSSRSGRWRATATSRAPTARRWLTGCSCQVLPNRQCGRSSDGWIFMRRSPQPRPSISEPRPFLLRAVLAFVRDARSCPGVLRIALLGSLVTAKTVPKDADVLVTIGSNTNLDLLARAGRRLKGTAQTINLGADVFLAEESGTYIGRICHYRECWRRVACRALNCGRRDHINDDLQIVTLAANLIAAPPVELWPVLIRRERVPPDVAQVLLAELEKDGTNAMLR
jgi:hypothetical protein